MEIRCTNEIEDVCQVIGIGGSAGATSDFISICRLLNGEIIPPLVLVLHSSEIGGLALQQTLSNLIRYPVSIAIDGAPLEKNHIYIAPSRLHISISTDHCIRLGVGELIHGCCPAIDNLFLSIANVYQHRAIGILLSGANEDGVQGMLGLSQVNALTTILAPELCEFPQMVSAAKSTTKIDLELSHYSIAQLIAGASHGY
ncbi:chemotaxis protein CheB [Pseudoalteromonas sp. CO348]|uniref:chemotaxis protein CheB n=1 Tax=unclassified Pseudoalteromonas TaxID=194690 RepID=UPI001023B0B1|nr:chemotaxis protein CheB [Pseudoalteromonas sp. CO348]MCG7540518.1 chemotaxis protein CheB [Pseudoalteromonas sp. OF7H-1]RZG07712.1 chemotaxis protein CheB [Pseudoalteromonas sp. CO348]